MSLDDALAGWAATVRLPEPAAEDVYGRIVATAAVAPAAAPLAATWWRDYTTDFTGRLVRSTRLVRLAA